MITAIVLVSADVHAITETAQAIADIDGVRETYSCAGDVDIVAIVAVRDHEQVATVVTGAINTVPGVRHTTTHIAFRTYSRTDVDAGFAVGE